MLISNNLKFKIAKALNVGSDQYSILKYHHNYCIDKNKLAFTCLVDNEDKPRFIKINLK